VVPEDTKENEPGEVVEEPPKGEGATGGVVVETGGIDPCREESRLLMVSAMVKRGKIRDRSVALVPKVSITDLGLTSS
jgi:hypothetical protein